MLTLSITKDDNIYVKIENDELQKFTLSIITHICMYPYELKDKIHNERHFVIDTKGEKEFQIKNDELLFFIRENLNNWEGEIKLKFQNPAPKVLKGWVAQVI